MRLNRKLGSALLIAAAAWTSGCYKATFVEDASARKHEPTYDEWTDHYLFGTIGDEEFDTREICPAGTTAVQTGGNVGTVTITILTIGIYAPRKVYFTCADQTQVASNTEVKP